MKKTKMPFGCLLIIIGAVVVILLAVHIGQTISSNSFKKNVGLESFEIAEDHYVRVCLDREFTEGLNDVGSLEFELLVKSKSSIRLFRTSLWGSASQIGSCFRTGINGLAPRLKYRGEMEDRQREFCKNEFKKGNIEWLELTVWWHGIGGTEMLFKETFKDR